MCRNDFSPSTCDAADHVLNYAFKNCHLSCRSGLCIASHFQSEMMRHFLTAGSHAKCNRDRYGRHHYVAFFLQCEPPTFDILYQQVPVSKFNATKRAGSQKVAHPAVIETEREVIRAVPNGRSLHLQILLDALWPSPEMSLLLLLFFFGALRLLPVKFYSFSRAWLSHKYSMGSVCGITCPPRVKNTQVLKLTVHVATLET